MTPLSSTIECGESFYMGASGDEAVAPSEDAPPPKGRKESRRFRSGGRRDASRSPERSDGTRRGDEDSGPASPVPEPKKRCREDKVKVTFGEACCRPF